MIPPDGTRGAVRLTNLRPCRLCKAAPLLVEDYEIGCSGDCGVYVCARTWEEACRRWDELMGESESVLADPRVRALAERAVRAAGVAQLRQAQEECGELVAAISRHARGRATTVELADEVADVVIVTAQCKEILSEEVLRAALDRKLVRFRERVVELELSAGAPAPLVLLRPSVVRSWRERLLALTKRIAIYLRRETSPGSYTCRSGSRVDAEPWGDRTLYGVEGDLDDGNSPGAAPTPEGGAR